MFVWDLDNRDTCCTTSSLFFSESRETEWTSGVCCTPQVVRGHLVRGTIYYFHGDHGDNGDLGCSMRCCQKWKSHRNILKNLQDAKMHNNISARGIPQQIHGDGFHGPVEVCPGFPPLEKWMAFPWRISMKSMDDCGGTYPVVSGPRTLVLGRMILDDKNYMIS